MHVDNAYSGYPMAAIVHAGYESIPVDPMRPHVPGS